MAPTSPTLHLFCGLAASGKSSLAAELGRLPGTVVIAEDVWLDALFAGEMSSLADYVRCAAKLRGIVGRHVADLLNAGLSVALDFPANTVEARRWMREILEHTDAAHRLHLLDVSAETCLARLRARNAGGDHPFSLTEDQFWRLARHFTPPTPDEGFAIRRHGEKTA